MSLFVLGFLKLFFVFSIVLFHTSNALSISTHQCFHDHFSALLDLKQSFTLFEGSNTELSSWNPDDSDCCHWEGVTCDQATGHVIGLDLSSHWITSRLDFESLFRLHSLEKLNLAYNYFYSTPFPFGFGQLENLTHLNLTGLHFYGQIPLDISQLTKLVSLDLSYNFDLKLEHPDIATLFQNLSNLRVLYLDSIDVRVQGNEWSRTLSYSLPHLCKLRLRNCGLSISIHSFLSQFDYLSELDLSGNNVSSEMLTLPLPHLRKLRLFDCGLSTSIHSFLSQLHFLSELNLGSNNFSYGLPAIPLPQLKKLSLFNCSLSVSIHSFFSQIPFLSELDLSFNDFSYGIPNSIRNLSSLTSLTLISCELWGRFPESLLKLNNIRFLDLSDNSGLTGKLPEFPHNNSFQHLTELRLYRCNFSRSLPPSLGNLDKLIYLDLSENSFNGPIPSSYGNGFSKLQELILFGNMLSESIPSSLFSLPSLKMLDLSFNKLNIGQFVEFHNASSSVVEVIDLSNNNFHGQIPSSLFELPKLKDLYLSENKFSSIPSSLFSIPSLKMLDLSSNKLNIGQFVEFHNVSSSVMEVIYLSENNFQGQIPMSLFELPKLRTLDLSSNNISGILDLRLFQNHTNLLDLRLSNNSLFGPLPFLLQKLKSLTSLDLSLNSFGGPTPFSYFNELPNLQRLSLSDNLLNGTIPSSLFSHPSLNELYLDGNQFSGQLDEFHNASSSPLEVLFFSRNVLSGLIPRSIFKLPRLTELFLSSNKFNGSVDLTFFQNVSSLSYLDLAFNNFSRAIELNILHNFKGLLQLDLSGNNVSIDDRTSNSTSLSLPQFKELYLSSCNIGGFPKFLKNQEQLRSLDLSNNRISGEMPKWVYIGNETLSYLNLSHNALNGLEQSFSQPLVIKVDKVDLSSNKLKGFLPIPSSSTFFLSLSSNRFGGEIPSIFCNATSLSILDLSENHLGGQIPPCLGEIGGTLNVLKLQRNVFTGTFVPTFKKGCDLQTLDLSGNLLEGQIPKSLINCTKLEVLNLGNNRIQDTFPLWLGTLFGLRILVLRSNKFHGSIEEAKPGKTFFPRLQIIDLSSNNFIGSLPSNLFQSWKDMMRDVESQSAILSRYIDGNTTSVYYQDTVIITEKGLEMELVKILDIFSSIDLSNNKFQGGIPKSIANLKSLHGLNMSHNNLTGPIPVSFRNLLQLESLDLSQNKLSGEIPWQLADLTFLEVVNFSQNHLVGRIPQSRQFFTFTNESFMGNSGLCGPPLSKECNDDQDGMSPSPLPSKDVTTRSESKFNWRSVWIGFGIGHEVGLGFFCWTLVLWNRGRRVYYNFIDRLLYKFSLYFPC